MRRGGGEVSRDIDLNGFVLKFLVVLSGSAQQKGVRGCRFALFDAGDDVGTTQPVGLGEVGRGPLRGMVRVRVIKADDVQSEATRLPLNFDEFLRGDVVAA